jgi:hypothetical protein
VCFFLSVARSGTVSGLAVMGEGASLMLVPKANIPTFHQLLLSWLVANRAKVKTTEHARKTNQTTAQGQGWHQIPYDGWRWLYRTV